MGKAVHDYITVSIFRIACVSQSSSPNVPHQSNTHRVEFYKDPGAFKADWDILTKIRVLEIYNVYTNHWMVRLVMLEADVQARAASK